MDQIEHNLFIYFFLRKASLQCQSAETVRDWQRYSCIIRAKVPKGMFGSFRSPALQSRLCQQAIFIKYSENQFQSPFKLHWQHKIVCD